MGVFIRLAVLAFALQASLNQAYAQDLFGVIEIGSSGVKAVGFQINPQEARKGEEEFQADERGVEAETKGLKYTAIKAEAKLSLKEFETNAHDQTNIGRTVDAVKRFSDMLENDKGIILRDQFVVISSGVARQSHLQQLTDELNKALPNISVDVVSAERESELTFKWITPRYRYHEVIVIDIGSGNVKACYAVRSGGAQELTGFEVSRFGVKTFSKEALARMSSANVAASRYPDFIREYRKKELTRDILQMTGNYPAFRARPRVYMVGGIVFATSTLIRPEKIGQNWISFPRGDIVTLYNRHRKNQLYNVDFTRISDRDSKKEKTRREFAVEEVARIRDRIFNPDEMLAGLEILFALDEILGLATKQNVSFAAVGRDGWRSQFLLEKIIERQKG